MSRYEPLLKKKKPNAPSSQHCITFPLYEITKNPFKVSESPISTLTLNFSNFKQWNSQQVACLFISDSGCNLPVEMVEPLFASGFAGYSLSNILDNLISYGEIETTNLLLKSFVNVNLDVCMSIVKWVKTNLTANSPRLIDATEILQFIEQFLSHYEISVCKTTNQNIIKSSAIVTHGFGANFQFLGRESVITNLYSCYNNYLQALSNSKDGSVDRNDIEIPFIAAAPGVGKSRILTEIGLSLFKEEKFFPLFLSFGNLMQIEDNERAMTSLCIRMIYSIICALIGGEDASLFRDLRTSWENYFTLEREIAEFNTIMQVCQQLVSQLLPDDMKSDGNKESISFFIGLDEAQHLAKKAKIDKSSLLDRIVSILGQYLQKPTSGKIFTLIVGTYFTGIRQSVLGSGYSALSIPVGAMLSKEVVYEIIDQLSIEHNILLGWRKNNLFKQYLRSFNGYARGVELFLKYFIRNKGENEAKQLAKDDILQKYDVADSLSFSLKNIILEHVITRRRVFKSSLVSSTESNTWSNLEDKGLVMLDPIPTNNQLGNDNLGYIITYPSIIFTQLLPNTLQESFTSLFNGEGLSWEDVVWNYYYLIIRILEDKEISVSELFPNAQMNSCTRDLQIGRIGSCKQCSMNDYSKLCLSATNEIFLVKNTTETDAGDIIILGMQSKNQDTNYVFHLQCKWEEYNKSTLDFSWISNEVKKNNLFKLPNNSDATNITVILTGKSIINMPTELSNNLVIICKDNFEDHFGIFAEQVKYLSSNYIHINECTIDELSSILDRNSANKILQIRNDNVDGFKNMQDLKTKLNDEELFEKLYDQCNVLF